MKTQQWFKITRHDGKVQYASKWSGEQDYFLYGYGFGIKEFDALSVEPVDEVPVNMVKGMAQLDDTRFYRAYNNINSWWNGWAMPYIHADDVPLMIEDISDESWMTMKLIEGIVTIEYSDKDNHQEGETQIVIEPTIIDNEPYYYFGNEGWVFDFRSMEDHETYLKSIEDENPG